MISRLALLATCLTLCCSIAHADPAIVFVTQPPHPDDFATANATFGNHLATLDSIPRGGDLYIRYADGTLKNVTAAAGFGNSGFQGANGIAVRDPAVHWNGEKIIFSMVVGAPTQRYQVQSYRWQLYEVTGIGQNQTPVITKVANQSANYNNVMPIYGTDERIIYVSDRPRAGLTHTYPQRDEYESTPTNTGLWSLNPATGEIFQLDHSPSGDFNPFIDSFGRVIFTRWDHLQRDQQNRCSQPDFKAMNFESETEGAASLDTDAEVYPEPRGQCEIPQNSNLDRHTFNHFLPWQIQEDGTGMETINHIGRHELVSYIGRSFNDDPAVEEFYGQYNRVNKKSIENLFQIKEDPNSAGAYFGVNAPEFSTHASGQIVRMVAPPSKAADQVSIDYLTHHDTANVDDTPSADHSGLSRDPLPTSEGTLIAAHAGTTLADTNIGSSAAPQSRYAFRLRKYQLQGDYYQPGTFLTSGITRTISFWSPDEMVSYNNVTLWELQPQEIRARTKPQSGAATLTSPEQQIFDQAQVNVEEFKSYLRDNNLALIVSRNVTTRDNLDHQQPLNLQVAGSSTKTVRNSGKLYQIAMLQIFQGDLIRGYLSNGSPVGRRVLAQPLHSVSSNPPAASALSGAVDIASDGSLAAFVPARQALTYQLTDPAGTGVVRERLWLTFQPGEIRVCASCHGVNSKDQTGASEPTNPPQALASLLDYWKGIPRQDPVLTLKLKAINTKKRGSSPARQKLRYSITGDKSISANKTVTLSVKAGKTNCGQVASFKTDANGSYEKTSKNLPVVAKKTPLKFSLQYFNKEMAKGNFKLKSGAGKTVKPNKLCKALKAALS